MTSLGRVWYRPALILFSESAPVVINDNAGTYSIGNPYADYITLSDDNRSDLSVSVERIEYKKRMINGRMRSYHVADKKSFDVSWTDFPSSSAIVSEALSGAVGIAGGKDILQWHEDHAGSFWMTLVYDTPSPDGGGSSENNRYRLEWYNVFFDSFDFNVTKRGLTYDHWNVSMSLVEV
jgi:hypothetical protein